MNRIKRLLEKRKNRKENKKIIAAISEIRQECLQHYDAERRELEKLDIKSRQLEKEAIERKYKHTIENLRLKIKKLKKRLFKMQREYKNFKILADKLDMISRQYTAFFENFHEFANKKIAGIGQEFYIFQDEISKIKRLIDNCKFPLLEDDTGGIDD